VQWYDFRPGLHSRPLLSQYELTTLKISSRLR
jgi:hypothetical protein